MCRESRRDFFCFFFLTFARELVFVMINGVEIRPEGGVRSQIGGLIAKTQVSLISILGAAHMAPSQYSFRGLRG